MWYIVKYEDENGRWYEEYDTENEAFEEAKRKYDEHHKLYGGYFGYSVLKCEEI